MEKRIVFIGVVLFLTIPQIKSQNFQLEWMRSIEHVDYQWINSMTIDQDGNTYCTLSFSDTLTVGQGPDRLVLSPPKGPGSGIFDKAGAVLIFDDQGEFLRHIFAATAPGNEISIIQLLHDADGGIYLLGQSSSDTFTINTWSDNKVYQFGLNRANAVIQFIMKIASDGQIVWFNTLYDVNGPVVEDYHDRPAWTLRNEQFAVYHKLRTSRVDIDPGAGVVETCASYVPFHSYYDAKTGDFLSMTTDCGGDFNRRPPRTFIDKRGHIFEALIVYGPLVDIDPGPQSRLERLDYETGILVRELDPGGNFVRGRIIGSIDLGFQGFDPSVYQVITDQQGRVHLMGGFMGNIGFGTQANGEWYRSRGGLDVYVISFDSLLFFQNIQLFGSLGVDLSQSLTETPDGGLLVGISSNGPIVADLNFQTEKVLLEQSPSPIQNGGISDEDLFLVKLSRDFSFEWYHQLGIESLSPFRRSIGEVATHFVNPNELLIYAVSNEAQKYVYEPFGPATTVVPDRKAALFYKLQTYPVSIDPSLEKPKAKLFPNPVTGTMQLSLPANAGKTKIQILDMAGKVIGSSVCHDQVLWSYQPNLPPGCYMLNIHYANHQEERIPFIVK
jgi:hypothetical protein